MPSDQSTPQPQPDATVFTLLAARARLAPDGRLALYAGVGIAGSAAVLLLHVEWWRLVLPCVAVAGFGVWGIADRMVSERAARGASAGWGTVGLRALKRVAAILGSAGALGTLLAGLGLLMGNWIS
ncbi:MAG TPA: hypothetical protein VFW98_17070 [Gemmatimonadaceae bacterium]|nr:hypothetical protein [Gemmatimonadaceae bacterium]